MANKDSEFFLEDEETVENNLIFRINIIGDLLLLREDKNCHQFYDSGNQDCLELN